VVSHAAATPGNVKWYESSFASAALGIVALIILVVFLVLVFRQNPSALIKVLGAVAALATALAGLVWGTRRGRKQVADHLLPEMQAAKAALEVVGATTVEHVPPATPSTHPPLAALGSHQPGLPDDYPPEDAAELSQGGAAGTSQLSPPPSEGPPVAVAVAAVDDVINYLSRVNK
jgi:hypothetical protein